MRMVVMSDSHGDAAAIEQVLKNEPTASVVIHLGDGAREASRLMTEYPSRQWHIVCGNCDIGVDVPEKTVVSLGGKRFYLTHGHAERVKSGLLNLSFSARAAEADAAFYGHTHCADVDFDGGIMLLNPGSVGKSGTYAVVTVENGIIRFSMCRL